MAHDPENPPWTRDQLRRGRAQAVARRRGRPPVERAKVTITIRLDGAVVDWFRAQGEGYQTRINEVLSDYVVRH